MGEGPPSMREGRGWGVSISITCWQGVAPSPVRRWSRQAAWPWHRTLPAECQVFWGGGALISWEQGLGTGKMLPGRPLTPVPSAAASAPGRRHERKRGEKKQSVSIQAVLPPSESRVVLTFLLPAA